MVPSRRGRAGTWLVRAPVRLTVKYDHTMMAMMIRDDDDEIHGTHSFRPVGSSGLNGSFRPVGSFQRICTTNIGPSEKGGSLVVGMIGNGPTSTVPTPGGLYGKMGRSCTSVIIVMQCVVRDCAPLGCHGG